MYYTFIILEHNGFKKLQNTEQFTFVYNMQTEGKMKREKTPILTSKSILQKSSRLQLVMTLKET
jgi:hypothetical protein